VRSIATAELLYPETALCIALLETGGFRARWMMKHHNWFGFRRNRRNYQTRTERGYNVYADPQTMLRDYAEFERDTCQRYSLLTEGAFREWVFINYAEDPNYKKKFLQNLKQIQTNEELDRFF